MTVSGSNWNEANEKATECLKQDPKAAFVHPYDQETTWQGHSTIVDEIKEQLESQGVCMCSEWQVPQKLNPSYIFTFCVIQGIKNLPS